jgi:hypothetical protein
LYHGVFLSEYGSISGFIRLYPQGRIVILLDLIESNESEGEENKGKSIKQRSN